MSSCCQPNAWGACVDACPRVRGGEAWMTHYRAAVAAGKSENDACAYATQALKEQRERASVCYDPTMETLFVLEKSTGKVVAQVTRSGRQSCEFIAERAGYRPEAYVYSYDRALFTDAQRNLGTQERL